MSIRNTGLGKGLDSLIPMSDDPSGKKQEEKKHTLDIFKIKPNPHQPRKKFNEEELNELADSIKEHGVIQPLVISKVNDEYILIAGERRLRASRIAGLREVPVILRDTKEIEMIEIALIENIQRSDLNPLEEAVSYRKLIDEFSLTQEDISKKVGKARSTVANTLRLLQLPVEAKQALRDGKITEGHARAILALTSVEQQLGLLNSILSGKLNVRQAESRITEAKQTKKDNDVIALEDELSNLLGTKVKIKRSGKGGKIAIEYYSDEELERIVNEIKKRN